MAPPPTKTPLYMEFDQKVNVLDFKWLKKVVRNSVSETYDVKDNVLRFILDNECNVAFVMYDTTDDIEERVGNININIDSISVVKGICITDELGREMSIEELRERCGKE